MSSLRGSPLWQLTATRVREFMREPEAVFWTFFFPVVIALALGIAFSGGSEQPVIVAVHEEDASALAEPLRTSERVDLRVLTAAEAANALRRGDVALVVTQDSAGGLLYRYDAAREEGRFARLLVDDVLQRAAGRADLRAASEVRITERGSRYIDFLIPGLIGLNLLSTGLWGVGYTVVRMRSDRLLKRFATTPVRRGDFLLSFMLGRLVFLAAELALVLGFAWIAFRVPVRGSLVTLMAVATIGAFSFTALGLLIASRARTTESVQGLMNLAAVPMWVLSGVFFSASTFPDAMQPFIQALPLTALNNAMRAIMLDGAGIADIAGSVAIVSAWGALSLGAAVAVFRWQ